ncbi:MAG TPA: transposase [Spirochaetia bacterium]|nr:transposase [Spirochaetia bacterium]
MKKRGKKKRSSSDGIKFTVIGEWFQGPGPADRQCKEGETPVDTEARLSCACVRWSFNRLLEGKTREELKVEGQALFGLNSRRVDDAIFRAQEVISSQNELLPLEIKETQTKLVRARKKLSKAEKDLAKTKQENDSVKIDQVKRTVHGRRMRVTKLSRKLAVLLGHQTAGTIPKVGHPPKVGRGGRSLWERVCKGVATNEEWKASRQNRLYARGDATKGGNPTIKIWHKDGAFWLAVTISHLSEQDGLDKLGRPKMSRAPRVEGRLWLHEKHWCRVYEQLRSGAPYTVELIKAPDGRIRAHITFTVSRPGLVTNSNRGFVGMDTNPDGVALANVGFTGQPEAWPEGFTVPYPKALHKFAGEFQVTVHAGGFLYITIPELAFSRSFRRTYLMGVLAKVVVEIARSLGKPLALERLGFGKDRLDTNRRFNRMATNFPFRKMIDAVIRKACREGVGVKQVWPPHTSTIGFWKYMARHGVVIHHAAALVIARRAMGFRERITNELKAKVESIKEKLILAVGSRPEEGSGMIRKAARRFKRLDGKLAMHNGLTRFKQEAFRSVWSDLKQLAWSSR